MRCGTEFDNNSFSNQLNITDMTETKQMYALVWCYEGVDDNNPSAQTIAVSESKERLTEEMMKWVKIDCERPNQEEYEDEFDYEDACWDDERNYEIVRESSTEVLLQHRLRTNLFVNYRIHSTKLL